MTQKIIVFRDYRQSVSFADKKNTKFPTDVLCLLVDLLHWQHHATLS